MGGLWVGGRGSWVVGCASWVVCEDNARFLLLSIGPNGPDDGKKRPVPFLIFFIVAVKDSIIGTSQITKTQKSLFMKQLMEFFESFTYLYL